MNRERLQRSPQRNSAFQSEIRHIVGAQPKAEDLRISVLESQIAAQIELVAELICENESAVEAELKLRWLEKQLAEEQCRREQ
jgi:phosphate uptake regulator